MRKFTSTITTTIINSDDGTHNYEVIRTLQNVSGKKAIILTLYPSFSGQDIFHFDHTSMHLLNHLQEIGVSSVRIINLFSKIVRGGKLSSRNLEVDEENMSYIEGIMKEKDFSSYVFIVAWGSSMITSKAACETKERIVSMYHEYNPNGTLCQLTCSDPELADNEAVHPLFLGIRNPNAKWSLAEYVPQSKMTAFKTAKDIKEMRNEVANKRKAKIKEEV